MSIKEQLANEVDRLTPAQQQVLLDYAKRLRGTSSVGTSGDQLLDYMNSFQFEPGAVDEMMKVIEEDCERVDWDGWG